MVHEQVVASLRREKDSLQAALSSEIGSRRALEQENEALRRKVLEYENTLRVTQSENNNLE